MHRTTIVLDSPVESALRRLMTEEKRGLKDMVNELLRLGVEAYRKTALSKKRSFKWRTWKGVTAPWFDPSDRSTYLDAISRNTP